MADRSGEQFGQYRLVRFIKEGGFGAVYEATHPRRGQVALKLLKRQLDERGLRDFLNDVRAVLLHHPHIIEIVDFGVEGQTPFLVMPYFVRGSLRARHPKGSQLPLPTIVDYVRQIGEALQYAHDNGTIHRDIKPDNVLLGSDGMLVLADFGIAVIFDQSKTHRTVEFAGSLEYAAPEQFLEKPGPASDQYALATMVYEWLSGVVPFPRADNPTPLAMGRKKTQEPPPRLAGSAPAIELVVLRALATDPKDRFPSVRTFMQALERATQPESSRYTTVGAPTTPVLRGASSAEVSPPLGTPLITYRGHTQRVQVLLWSPNSTFLASKDQFGEIHIWSVATGRYVLIWPARVGINEKALAWAPDSSKIAWWSTDGTAEVWDLTTGDKLCTYRRHRQQITSLAWSPDSRYLATASTDWTIQVWDATTGHHLATYQYQQRSPESAAAPTVVWAPDGSRLASSFGDRAVQVWGVPKDSLTYFGHSRAVTRLVWSHDSRYIASVEGGWQIRIWQAADGEEVATFNGPIYGLAPNWAWASDSQSIVSVSWWAEQNNQGYNILIQGFSKVIR